MNIRSITAPNPGPFTLDGTRTYLLGDHTIIDPGPAIESHVKAILEAMPDPTTILITHRHDDHAPAALLLRRKRALRVVAPAGVLTDEDVTRRIAGGEVIETADGPLQVIATPGHTREHVCFLTEDRALFSGDTILGTGTTTIFPPDGNMADYLRSLRTLRSLEPLTVHPAHGPSHENAVRLIDHYIAHRLERENQVLDSLHHGASTIPAMLRRIYPELDPRLEEAAEIQIAAHLTKLIGEGRVSKTGSDFALQ